MGSYLYVGNYLECHKIAEKQILYLQSINYSDYELENKVTDQVLDEYTMLGNDHLFERYKYVFNYDSDNDVYYFESVEKHEGDI